MKVLTVRQVSEAELNHALKAIVVRLSSVIVHPSAIDIFHTCLDVGGYVPE